MNQYYAILLNKYADVEKIGEGGQAEVFKVKDKSTNLFYALKIFKSFNNLLPTREIKALNELSHQNIIQVHDSDFTENKGGFILMQYMEHGDIEQYIRKNNINITQRLELLQGIANALIIMPLIPILLHMMHIFSYPYLLFFSLYLYLFY